ncbi:hypothetical protein C8R46DRAFT_1123241 [Mycena filopes]|nr:hypothetical protein C8R46DRAFT_1123241 [Mycena filopes]
MPTLKRIIGLKTTAFRAMGPAASSGFVEDVTRILRWGLLAGDVGDVNFGGHVSLHRLHSVRYRLDSLQGSLRSLLRASRGAMKTRGPSSVVTSAQVPALPATGEGLKLVSASTAKFLRSELAVRCKVCVPSNVLWCRQANKLSSCVDVIHSWPQSSGGSSPPNAALSRY